MPKVAVYNIEGQQVGEIDLSETVFGADVNPALLHQAVVMYEANMRVGTAATKTRSLVRGGGRKPWRQKGTGRARHGSIRSPIWVGGATTFGPQPRDYRQSLPRKARRQALRAALSAKVNAGELIVLDQLQLAEPKTRGMARILTSLGAETAPLIVTAEQDRNVRLSARNLPGVTTALPTDLNVRQVLAHRKLVLTKDAVAKVEEVLG